MSAPVLELRGVTKRFGSVVANDAVNLAVYPGSIHAVIGENGAGKSTAMKIAFGLYTADSGAVVIREKVQNFLTPRDALSLGLGMVQQHFTLAGPFSAMENIVLGNEPGPGPLVNWKSARQEIERINGRYGFRIQLDALVEDQSIGIQQQIELARNLYRASDILILDEPTALLTPQEIEVLFDNLRRLRDEGKAVVLISHKMKEVMAISGEVTVFRQGKVVAHQQTKDTTSEELAELMIGRLPRPVERASRAVSVSAAAPALEVADVHLKRNRANNAVSLRVRAGEIVGIAGVEGNGQTELVRAILRIEPIAPHGGRIVVLGKDVIHSNTAEVRRLGVSVIPEDRHLQGLLLERPLYENILLGLPDERRFRNRGLIRKKVLRETTAALLQSHEVRPANPDAMAGTLSGGNQQKVIIAREFARKPRLILAIQPARGLDLGAMENVHRQLIQARDEGAGVMLVSSDLDEILTLSDRILVLFEGKINAEFPRGAAAESQLGLAMSGQSPQ